MTRILSALVLLPFVLLVLFLLPPWGTLVLALVLVALGFAEYSRLTSRLGCRIPTVPAAIAALATAFATAQPSLAADEVLMAVVIALGALGLVGRQPGPTALQDVAAAAFGVLYLGLPFGAMAAIRLEWGPQVLVLLLATIMVSDAAQFYGGRLLGRRLLSPAISPKKTVEGALAGLVAGPVVMLVGGQAWLPGAPALLLGLFGGAVAALGMAGDLFESLLKRSAGLKDSSGLIPGHGGVLDRVDSLLFAAPIYYLVLRHGFVQP